MGAELQAVGWTLICVAVPAFFVALVTAMANSDISQDFDLKALGWCLALLVVATICGTVGVTTLVVLSALK
jgi:hypothetical protein